MISDSVSPAPLIDLGKFTKRAEACVLVIFGATGDLTARKLMPALYHLFREGELPSHFACVGFARRSKSQQEFREEMRLAVMQYRRTKEIDPSLWNHFAERIYYHQSDFGDDAGYLSLQHFLQALDAKIGTKGNRLFYLSTQPSDFAPIVEKLHQHNLLYPYAKEGRWSRLIVEKPFGRDLDSAIHLQKELTRYVDERQIYRIDHYLGKETVQNILVLRFANSIFESIWNHSHIDHVQITVAEDMGIGSRGRFFEEAGMLRDIVQNHAMQLLSLIAMEPPVTLSAEAIGEEKVKVLQSIRPLPKDRIEEVAVRGQYGSGFVGGESVKGYREEAQVAPSSHVETFVALQLWIDNWRWMGVPFFIRAGKRLAKRATEIVITFKETPGYLFTSSSSPLLPNTLLIRIQPDEGISLKMNCKVPALHAVIQPVKMDFQYGSTFGSKPPEAYERLICECMAGDRTLFAQEKEVLHSWNYLTPLLHRWDKNSIPIYPYVSGSWGPDAANLLISRHGRKWHLP